MKLKAFPPTPVLAFFSFLLFYTSAYTQTLLIDPAGDGGFETGTTFAANGWTAVNATENFWEIGTAATAYAGSRGIYIANPAGTYAYSTSLGVKRTSHFYRDITIPACAANITLSFYWKGKGESGWDRCLVYTAPASVTPLVNSPASSSTTLSGATLRWTQPTYSQTSYVQASITGLDALAGTTVRFIFTWQNDGSTGSSPGTAIDNISLTYTPPSLSVISPSSSSVTSTTAILGGNISTVSCTNTIERGIYFSTTNGFADGTGTKVSESPGPFSTGVFTEAVNGLSPSTTYYFKAFARDASNTAYSSQGTFTTMAPPSVFVNATSGTLYGEYLTLKEAFDKINDGTHKGNISITIGGSAGQTITETAQAVLNKSGSGSASYGSVTLSPAFPGVTLSASFAGACCEPTGIIKLNGAENVTIDGRVGMSGTGSNLTIENLSTGTYASAIFLSGANNNSIRYCTLKSSTTATLNGAGTLSFIASGTSGCSNNTVEYCTFTKSAAGLPNNAIASYSSSSTYKSQNNSVRYCTISDFQKSGIWLGNSSGSGYNDLWTIDNNTFQQASTITINSTNFYNYAIMIGYHDGGGSTFRNEQGQFTITNNNIGGNGSGGDWTVTSTTGNSSLVTGGIFMAAGTTAYSEISGNKIASFNITTYVNTNTSISGFNGIFVYHTKTKIGSSSGNTIHDVFLDHKSTWGGVISGITIKNNANYYCEISNNQIYNINAESGASGYFQNFYGIYDWAESSLFSDVINKNTITNINLNLNSHGYGINASGAITQNHISKIKVSNGTADLTGIYSFGTPTADRPNYRVDNNEVILGLDNTGASTATGRSIYGIVINGIGYAYYNSILLQGSHSGSTNTYCLKLSTSSGTGFNIANNLLYNARTGGTGTHYCFMTNSTNAITSSNNAYIFEGSNSKAGLWNNATICNTLPDWAAQSAESNSIDTTVSAKPVSTLFPDANTLASDLFPNDDKWLCAGKVVIQTVDFMNTPRNNPAPTTIGAYEKNCPLLLPVELIRFEANETSDGSALVQWATSSEINSDYFILEKAAGNSSFTVLSTTKAAGNSNSLSEYSYLDDTGNDNGIVYYRLIQVDFNGVTDDLGTTILKREQNGNIHCQVYPNPADGYFVVNVLSDNQADCIVTITDASGRTVKTLSMPASGSFFTSGPLELPVGYYGVCVKQQTDIFRTVVVVN